MNFPILSSLILLPSIGALFILFAKSSNKNSMLILLVSTIFSLYFAFIKTNSFFKAIESISFIILFIELTEYLFPLRFLNIFSSSIKFSSRKYSSTLNEISLKKNFFPASILKFSSKYLLSIVFA